jgi:hypothetical protein
MVLIILDMIEPSQQNKASYKQPLLGRLCYQLFGGVAYDSIPSVFTHLKIMNKKNFLYFENESLNTGLTITPERPCMSNIFEKMDNLENDVGVANQQLSQIFWGS